MTYTIHHTAGHTTECNYYWINPEQQALYYTMEVPEKGSNGNDITKGYLPIGSVTKITINEKQDTGN